MTYIPVIEGFIWKSVEEAFTIITVSKLEYLHFHIICEISTSTPWRHYNLHFKHWVPCLVFILTDCLIFNTIVRTYIHESTLCYTKHIKCFIESLQALETNHNMSIWIIAIFSARTYMMVIVRSMFVKQLAFNQTKRQLLKIVKQRNNWERRWLKNTCT